MNTTTPEALQDDTTYAAFFIENLRTNEARQVGLVSGAEAKRMLARSNDPRRLAFELA